MKRLFALLIFLFLCATATAKESILLKMAQGDYIKASRIKTTSSKTEAGRQEILLQARALFHAEKFSEAINIYKKVLKSSDSLAPSFTKAQFGLAQSYAKLTQYKEAEAYYSAGLSLLTSSAMRESNATEFFNEANTLFEKETPMSLTSALSLYDLAMTIADTGDLYEKILFTKAKAYLYKNDINAAASALKSFIKSYPSSRLYWDAMYESVKTFRTPDTWAKHVLTTIEEQAPNDSMRAVALWSYAKLYKMPNPTNTENLFKGIRALERLIQEYPQFDRIDDARYYIATSALSDKIQRPTLADSLLPTYLHRGTSAERKIEIEFLQAVSLERQGKMKEAQLAYEQFIRKNSFHEKTDAAHKKIENIWWSSATEAFNEGKWRKAIHNYEKYLKKYPDRENSPLAYVQKAKAFLNLSDTVNAFLNFDTLAIEYPRSKWNKRGQIEKAKLLLTKDPSSEQAYSIIKEFATYGNGDTLRNSWGETSLFIEPTSPFQSNEKVQLHCKIQGIDSLTLDIYAIDEEQYFREKMSMNNIEKVAIDLCKPEKTHHFSPHFPNSKSPVAETVTLPINRAGIYLVRIKGNNLEVVTTVTVSDIRSILKQSPKGSLLYIENSRTGKKVPDATVLFTDSAGIVYEGKSDKEGVLLLPTPKESLFEQSYGTFIRSGNHVSWIKSKKCAATPKTKPIKKERIYTDKTLYTKIDTTYITVLPSPINSGWLSVRNSSGVIIAADTIKASSQLFTLTIPPHRHRLGEYSINLQIENEAAYSAHYRVGENSFIEKEKDYTLTLSLKDSLIFKRDTIFGSIQLTSGKGNVVQGLPVKIHTSFGELYTQTDQKGAATFALPNKSNIDNTHSLYVRAEIAALDIREKEKITYVKNAFNLSLQSPQTNREDKSMTMRIDASSPMGGNDSAKVTLKLFNYNYTHEKLFLLEERSISTDMKTEVSLGKIPAGLYRAELHSLDRFGNPIFDEHFFTVLPKAGLNKDAFEIEITETLLTPSESLQLNLKSKSTKGHLLCTFETDTILSYALIPITQKEQMISLPLNENMVPNVRFSATAFDHKNGVHHFSKELKISKELELTIDTVPTPTAGDSLTLTMHVKDIKKTPHSAMVSLFIQEDQWGTNKPDNFYPALYERHLYRMENRSFDTLSTKGQFGIAVAGLSTEERENGVGFFVFNNIRKELTKEAKDEYAGIGLGYGEGVGFAGGSGGVDKLSSLMGKSRTKSDSLRKRNTLKKRRPKRKLGDHFKEYWISTSIKSFSDLKTDAEGNVTFTVVIPDSIKNGITISAIAMDESGYIGTFQSTLPLINTPYRDTLQEKGKITPPASYTISIERKEGAENYVDVFSFIKELPFRSYYKHHPLYATKLSLSTNADSALFFSALLQMMTEHKEAAFSSHVHKNRRNNLTALRLLQRTKKLPDWIGKKAFIAAQVPSLIDDIMSQRESWFLPLCQMEQLALIDPSLIPTMRLQRADRERATLSPSSLAALSNLWTTLNRKDKVTELLPQVHDNLSKHLKKDSLNSDLLLSSLEVLLRNNSESPLISKAMRRVVEDIIPQSLNQPNQLASIMLLLADYYGERPQYFSIVRNTIESPASDTLSVTRHFFALPQKYLGTYLSPEAAMIQYENDSLWEIDSIKNSHYVVVKVTIPEKTKDKEFILTQQIPQGCTYVTGSEGVYYDNVKKILTFIGSNARQSRYILKVHKEGVTEFPAFLQINGKTKRVGKIDTLTVVSTGEPLQNPDSPYTLYEKGSLAYKRGMFALALPLLEKSRELSLEDIDLLEKLLYCAINTKNTEKIVSYFEEAKEHNPELIIPFESITPIQNAYRQMKLYESGFRLAKGATESRFIEEMNIIGTLEAIAPKLGKKEYRRKKIELNNKSNKKNSSLRSMVTMDRVTKAYPHGPLNARSLYLFSHLLYDRIDQNENVTKEQEKRILQQIEELLHHYLAEYQSPVDKDNAQFTIAAAALDEERSDKAIRWAFPHRGEKATEMSTTVQVLKAYALFLEDRLGEAQKICRTIRNSNSEKQHNRELATYVLAQTYHSAGDMKKALPLYEEVASIFTDANQVFANSQIRKIEIPEIHSLTSGENRLPLSLTNIDTVVIKTYPIDLLRFLERYDNGREMSDVNLSGVTPLYNKREILPKRVGIKQSRSFETGIKKNGTYITFVQTRDTLLYSIIIKGNLSVSINKTRSSTIHVSVEGHRGNPIDNATILIKNHDLIIKGSSDKRGVFQTASSTPTPTVIAQKGNLFGVYIQEKAPRTVVYSPYISSVKKPQMTPKKYIQSLRQDKKRTQQAFFNQDVQGVILNQL